MPPENLPHFIHQAFRLVWLAGSFSLLISTHTWLSCSMYLDHSLNSTLPQSKVVELSESSRWAKVRSSPEFWNLLQNSSKCFHSAEESIEKWQHNSVQRDFGDCSKGQHCPADTGRPTQYSIILIVQCKYYLLLNFHKNTSSMGLILC